MLYVLTLLKPPSFLQIKVVAKSTPHKTTLTRKAFTCQIDEHIFEAGARQVQIAQFQVGSGDGLGRRHDQRAGILGEKAEE